MSTHTLETVAPMIKADSAPALAEYANRMTDPASRTPKGTMRAWFQAHEGQAVDTLQIQPYNVWAPLNRTIDQVKAGSVIMDGSGRDFKGHKVLHATDTELMVSYDFGGPAVALFRLTDSK